MTYPLFHHRTKAEEEVWRRIKVAVWAYAYEIENVSLVPDWRFDEECKLVDLSVNTTRPDLDEWWRKEFEPDTGMWIHNHPELRKIKMLYDRFYK